VAEHDHISARGALAGGLIHLMQDSLRRSQRRHRERSAAIQGPPPQPYDPLDRRVASLLAMTIPSKQDVL
jgi:hypothetical protein